jgi:hypothetical protein
MIDFLDVKFFEYKNLVEEGGPHYFSQCKHKRSNIEKIWFFYM